MTKNNQAQDNLIKANLALENLRSRSTLIGREIVIASESEMVVVSQLPNDTLVVNQFCKCLGGTGLGNNVLKMLASASLPVK